MRRLRQIIFNTLVVLSLLLCGYALIAAIFAMREGDQYLRGYDIFQPLESPRRFYVAEWIAYRAPPPALSFAGFRVQGGLRIDYFLQHVRVYTIPYWFLSLTFAVPPSLWLRARRRNWRRMRSERAGLCPTCHYDLRATPDRCPECGAIPAKAKA